MGAKRRSHADRLPPMWTRGRCADWARLKATPTLGPPRISLLRNGQPAAGMPRRCPICHAAGSFKVSIKNSPRIREQAGFGIDPDCHHRSGIRRSARARDDWQCRPCTGSALIRDRGIGGRVATRRWCGPHAIRTMAAQYLLPRRNCRFLLPTLLDALKTAVCSLLADLAGRYRTAARQRRNTRHVGPFPQGAWIGLDIPPRRGSAPSIEQEWRWLQALHTAGQNSTSQARGCHGLGPASGRSVGTGTPTCAGPWPPCEWPLGLTLMAANAAPLTGWDQQARPATTRVAWIAQDSRASRPPPPKATATLWESRRVAEAEGFSSGPSRTGRRRPFASRYAAAAV